MTGYETWIKSLSPFIYERYLVMYSQYKQSLAGASDETIAARYNLPVKAVRRNIKAISTDIEREPKRLQHMIDNGRFSDYVRNIARAMDEYPERWKPVSV